MPTFEDPAADADEVQIALRALAHATRSIADPRDIYSVLGSLTSAVASLGQSLHQLAAFHDAPATVSKWVVGEPRTTRTAAHNVSWELHRSAEILNQVSDSIAHAHSSEARISYEHRDFPVGSETAQRTIDQRLGL